MATILITGGAGYIGSHAAWALLDVGGEIVVLDDLSSGLREAVPPRAAFVLADVTDGKTMRSVLRRYRIEAILHFAGRASAPGSVGHPLEHHRINTGGVVSLLEACVDCGVDRVVLSSTAAVYGDVAECVNEGSPTCPISPYGRSKLAAEWVLTDAARAHGLRAAALRYFNVAGADPEGRAGQSARGATHLFRTACEAVLGRRQAVDVYGEDWPTPDGTGVRDYIHVHDLVQAHLLTLTRLVHAPAGACEVLNLGLGRGSSVREVVQAVGDAAGRRVPLKSAPRRPGDMAALVADASRARQVLRWSPRYGLDDMAAHSLAWEQRHLTSTEGA